MLRVVQHIRQRVLNETFFSEFIKKKLAYDFLMGDLVRLDPSLRVLFNRWRNVLV